MRSVSITNNSRRVAVDEAAVAAFIHGLDTLDAFAVPPGTLSLVFLDEADHCHYHAEFLDDPEPTDVITFAGDEDTLDDSDENLAGEILINVEFALAYAKRHGTTADEELALYIAHGWLHLAGLDDQSAAEAAAMRDAEATATAHAKGRQLMPAFRWVN